MKVLVCVGSTKFPELVRLVLLDRIINHLKTLGFNSIFIQAGEIPEGICENVVGIEVKICKYIPYLEDKIKESDLVICHGGTGCILEALRFKKKVVAVANPLLSDNHQRDFICSMNDRGYIYTSTLDSTDMINVIRRAMDSESNTWKFDGGEKFMRLIYREVYGSSSYC